MNPSTELRATWQPVALVAVKTLGAFAGGIGTSYGMGSDLDAALRHGCLLGAGFLLGHIFPQANQSNPTPEVKS